MNATRARRSPAWIARCSIALVLLVIIGLLPADAATRRLTTMTANDIGAVEQLQYSPDGNYIVYRANYDDVDTLEFEQGNYHWDLYTTPSAGGEVVRLSTALPAYTVTKFAISPDSSRIVFQAQHQITQQNNLYSVLIGGSEIVKLSQTYTSTEVARTMDFAISADSSRVVFRADIQAPDAIDLYSVPIAGGAPTRLSPSYADTTGYQLGAREFKISPDSSRVVYRELTTESYGLRSVPITGGSDVFYTPPITTTNFDHFSISADSSRLLAATSAFESDSSNLYSALLTSTEIITIATYPSSPYPGVGYQRIASFTSMSDGQVVYSVINDSEYRGEIYTVPQDGITEPLLLSTDNGSARENFALTPDKTNLVYISTLDGDASLLSVPVSGGIPFTITNELFYDLGVEFIVGEEWVIYREYGSLYSVPLTGGAVVVLTPNDQLTSVESFTLVEDDSRVVFEAKHDTSSPQELFSVPVGGGEPVRISTLLAEGDNAYIIGRSPDGTKIAFSSGEVRFFETDRTPAIFQVSGLGGTPSLIDRTRTIVGDVFANRIDNLGIVITADPPNIQLSADGDFIYYLADAERDDFIGFYRASLSSGEIELLSDAGHNVSTFKLAPAGAYAYYDSDKGLYSVSLTELSRISLTVDNYSPQEEAFSPDGKYLFVMTNNNLQRIAIDGSESIDLANNIYDFQISPDGSHVVFVYPPPAFIGAGSTYSRKSDGSAPAVKLHSDSFGTEDYYAITPDSQYVLFIGGPIDESNNYTGDKSFYRVPIGGGATTSLIGEAYSAPNITFTADGSRAIITTYNDPHGASPGQIVRSVPISGGPVMTLCESDSGTTITSQTSANGLHTICAAFTSNSDYTLTRVPTLGGAATTIYSATNVSEVSSFAITPDSSAVVFRTPDGVASASLTGTVTTTLASGLEGYEGELTISADSARVFFTGVSTVEGQRARRLYVAPLDGSDATVINGPLIERGNVTDFLVHPNGHGAVYRADADKDEVYELYSTDGLSATLRLTTQNATVIEGSGTTTITVGLSAPQLTETEVEYTLSGTATEGDDYTIAAAPAAALTFAPGETSKSLLVTILDDNVDEVAETIIITFALPNGASQSVTLTIPANDTVIVDPEVRLYLPIVRR